MAIEQLIALIDEQQDAWLRARLSRHWHPQVLRSIWTECVVRRAVLTRRP